MELDKMIMEKRKDILRILKSGWSAKNISYQIGAILNQPEDDILRIIQSQQWNIRDIMVSFDYFKESKIPYKDGGYLK